jgi:hypothetical protein
VITLAQDGIDRTGFKLARQYNLPKSLKMPGSSKEVRNGHQSRKLLRFVPVLCIGVLLLNTYLLYKGSYFWGWDFTNLYNMQQESFPHMIGDVVNPVSSLTRPIGLMCYWLLFRFFDLNPAAYHGLAHSLHAANTVFIYFILKRLTESRPGAAIGAMLFASQAVFARIYWNFGTIFEIVAAFFFFVGILLWISERRGWLHVVVASLVLLLAVKGKEMALTLPLIWLSYDLLLRNNMERRMAAHWVLPGGLALWYGLITAAPFRGVLTSHPYYMSIKGSTLASGFEIYFNMLFKTNFSWQIWCIGFVALLLLFALLRSRLALFFQLYVFITFLPVIFLVNHRCDFYWYLPFLGLCGLAAILAKAVAGVIETRNPPWLAEGGAYAVFALLCWGSFLLHEEGTRKQRSWVRDHENEYRAFVKGLRALPPPAKGETIFFDSHPSLFNERDLIMATQVAFHRTDLQAKLVATFPSEARYRLRFQKSRLIVLPGANREKQ